MTKLAAFGEVARRARAALGLGWSAAPWALTVSVGLALVDGALPVVAAWGTKLLLDELTGARRPGPVGVAVAIIGGSGLLLGGLRAAARYTESLLRRALRLTVQQRLFATVNAQVGLEPFENPEYLNRLRLAEDAGDRAPDEVVSAGVRVVQSALQTSGFVVALLVVWPPIVLFVLAAAVGVGVLQTSVGRRRAALIGTLSPLWRRQIFYRNLLTDVRAAKEVRLFALGDFLHDRMMIEARTAAAAELGTDRDVLRTDVLLGAVASLVLVVGTAVAAYQALYGGLSIGDLSLFVASVGGINGAVAGAAGATAQAYEALLLFGHYLDLVATPEQRAGGGGPAPPLRAGIVFQNVWFRYADDAPWVLRDATFTIAAGTSVGLVGLNGAGKSTIVKLLCRFYEPQAGRITWDGTDLGDLSPAALRERISAVFQDFMAYDLSAWDNIGMGRLAARDDLAQIRTAARTAGIDDDLAALPGGYRTMLSRIFTADEVDGASSGLSGGQWQRVALARAYLRADADLLILDEPSSGLDAAAEAALHARLADLRQGRTSLLISHRLAALRNADLIVVLEQGQVVEQGPHVALIEIDGRYAAMFHTQAAGYLDAVEFAATQ